MNEKVSEKLKELSRYYFVTREIEQIENRIKELTQISASVMSGMPHSPSVQNQIERYVEEKIKLENLMIEKYSELMEENIRIEEYLKTVKDSEIRMIIRECFIKCRSWDDIAYLMKCSKKVPYMKLSRYLEKKERDEVNDKVR